MRLVSRFLSLYLSARSQLSAQAQGPRRAS